MVEVNLLTGIREHLPFNQKQAYITTGFSIASPLLESQSLKIKKILLTLVPP